MSAGYLLLCCLGTIAINVCLVGLNLKIYTELVKDKLQDKRKEIDK